MVPLYLIGGIILSTAGRVISRDIEQVWTAEAARAEVARERKAGRAPLLRIRKLQVNYGPVKVLTGVDLDVDEGEIVALLGTNGAGKSTLLHAIAGVVEADRGAIVLDGRDITHAPPQEVAAQGVSHVAGGIGTFPSLTVAEHLELAAWLVEDREAAKQRALDAFPLLGQRMDAVAGDLSGGQQQMLALGMALVSQPKLLLVDELSLGLAPAIVSELLDVVRAIAKAGTTVVVVEQSVQLALTVAETAYFLEKGRIRFHGPTAELLERDDVLRSVFLGHALADDNGGLASRANGGNRGNGGNGQGDAAAAGPLAPAVGAARPIVTDVAVADGRGGPCGRPRPRRRAAAGGRGADPQLRRREGGRRRVAHAGAGRAARHHRRQRGRQDHAVRPDLGVRAGRGRTGPARRPRRDPLVARPAGASPAWAARSSTPSCSRP